MRGLQVDLEGPESSTMTRFAWRGAGAGFTRVLPRNGLRFSHVRLLRPARYQLNVRLNGYKPATTAALVRGGESVRVEVFLQK